MRSVHILEKVRLPDGSLDIICNCFSRRLECGIKGKVCSHVALMYMVEGLASPKPKERLLISGGQKRRGAPGTSHKQLF